MKKLSLQWRITIMTVLLIGATCVFMNVLIGYSGRHYMNSIGSYISGNVETDGGKPEYFDPEQKKLDEELTIIYYHQLVYHGGGNGLRRCACVFFKRTRTEAPAHFYFSSGKGSAEQSDGHEDQRRCPAGIPAIQPVVQSDA